MGLFGFPHSYGKVFVKVLEVPVIQTCCVWPQKSRETWESLATSYTGYDRVLEWVIQA